MSGQQMRDALQAVDRITSQTQQMLPYWEELLKRAHDVADAIEQQVRKATAEAESPASPDGQAFQQAQQ